MMHRTKSKTTRPKSPAPGRRDGWCSEESRRQQATSSDGQHSSAQGVTAPPSIRRNAPSCSLRSQSWSLYVGQDVSSDGWFSRLSRSPCSLKMPNPGRRDGWWTKESRRQACLPMHKAVLFWRDRYCPSMSAKSSRVMGGSPRKVEVCAAPDTEPRPTRWIVNQGKSKASQLTHAQGSVFLPKAFLPLQLSGAVRLPAHFTPARRHGQYSPSISGRPLRHDFKPEI